MTGHLGAAIIHNVADGLALLIGIAASLVASSATFADVQAGSVRPAIRVAETGRVSQGRPLPDTPRRVSTQTTASVARAGARPGERFLAEPRMSTIGVSQNGEPLVIYALGGGAKRVLILGGQHGGPEANTVELVGGLLEFFDANPALIPGGIELDVLPVANPDGLAAGSRQFTSGVDPDRNWGSGDWQPDGFDSNAVFRMGLGGPEPFSEQETRALGDWILANKPVFIVNYHSAGGFMFGSREGAAGELSAAYAAASGYLWPAPGGRSPLPYSASGSMNVWLREAGVAAILVELSTPRVTEVERNLAGLQAVLQLLGGADGGADTH